MTTMFGEQNGRNRRMMGILCPNVGSFSFSSSPGFCNHFIALYSNICHQAMSDLDWSSEEVKGATILAFALLAARELVQQQHTNGGGNQHGISPIDEQPETSSPAEQQDTNASPQQHETTTTAEQQETTAEAQTQDDTACADHPEPSTADEQQETNTTDEPQAATSTSEHGQPANYTLGAQIREEEQPVSVTFRVPTLVPVTVTCHEPMSVTLHVGIREDRERSATDGQQGPSSPAQAQEAYATSVYPEPTTTHEQHTTDIPVEHQETTTTIQQQETTTIVQQQENTSDAEQQEPTASDDQQDTTAADKRPDDDTINWSRNDVDTNEREQQVSITNTRHSATDVQQETITTEEHQEPADPAEQLLQEAAAIEVEQHVVAINSNGESRTINDEILVIGGSSGEDENDDRSSTTLINSPIAPLVTSEPSEGSGPPNTRAENSPESPAQDQINGDIPIDRRRHRLPQFNELISRLNEISVAENSTEQAPTPAQQSRNGAQIYSASSDNPVGGGGQTSNSPNTSSGRQTLDNPDVSGDVQTSDNPDAGGGGQTSTRNSSSLSHPPDSGDSRSRSDDRAPPMDDLAQGYASRRTEAETDDAADQTNMWRLALAARERADEEEDQRHEQAALAYDVHFCYIETECRHENGNWTYARIKKGTVFCVRCQRQLDRRFQICNDCRSKFCLACRVAVKSWTPLARMSKPTLSEVKRNTAPGDNPRADDPPPYSPPLKGVPVADNLSNGIASANAVRPADASTDKALFEKSITGGNASAMGGDADKKRKKKNKKKKKKKKKQSQSENDAKAEENNAADPESADDDTLVGDVTEVNPIADKAPIHDVPADNVPPGNTVVDDPPVEDASVEDPAEEKRRARKEKKLRHHENRNKRRVSEERRANEQRQAEEQLREDQRRAEEQRREEKRRKEERRVA
ncbi:hypothetical protein F5Y16DRAFT_150042 [Xylariaceae sp. FL0255]|nr:hypothetical protein F5Y16DRAFT_150042 [Xylariaceae sp. FL0255]